MSLKETLESIGLAATELEKVLEQAPSEAKLKKLLKQGALVELSEGVLEKLNALYAVEVEAPKPEVEVTAPAPVVPPQLMVTVENNSGRKIELSSRVGDISYAIRILPHQVVELPEELTHDCYYLDLKNNRILIER
jgi:hypothetical protein